jgi:hypothetical protein
MLQHEMQIANTACDNNLLCAVVTCEWLACLASLSGNEQAEHCFHNMADAVYFSVCACMQSQHHAQLKARDSGAVPTFSYVPGVTIFSAPVAPVMVAQPQPVYVQQQPQPVMMQQQQQPMYAPPQPQFVPPVQQGVVYGLPASYSQQGPPKGNVPKAI